MAIVIEETVTGSTTSAESFSLTSWTPGSNELILVAVSMRDDSNVPTLSGNGLTFVQHAHHESTRVGVIGIFLFRAMGASPSTGQITVTVTGNSKPVTVVASRFSGVDTTGINGSGALEGSTGTADEGGTDNDDVIVSVTTVTDDALAFACATHRHKSLNDPPDTGETTISLNNSAGTGGDVTSLSTWYEGPVNPAGSTILGASADLSSDEAWAALAVSIKPAAAGGGGALPMAQDNYFRRRAM